MQDTESGGIFRNVTAPGGTSDYGISTENCWSSYAGLSLLKQTLQTINNNNNNPIKFRLSSNRNLTLGDINKVLEDIEIIQTGLIK